MRVGPVSDTVHAALPYVPGSVPSPTSTDRTCLTAWRGRFQSRPLFARVEYEHSALGAMMLQGRLVGQAAYPNVVGPRLAATLGARLSGDR